MTASLSILFVCDAGAAVGGGHVMRCLTLARALEARGAACAFEDLAAVRDLLAIFAPDMRLRLAEATEPVVVLDSYRLTPADEERWRARCRHLVVLDDLARPHAADLVIDPSFGREPRDYAPTPALTGPAHALVRPAFVVLRQEALARRAARPRRALVSLGLTDLRGITGKVVAGLLASHPDLELEVVVGHGAPSLPALKALAEAGRIALHVDTPYMADLTAACDVAIGAGGSSVWERACLGLPSVTLILADNQRDMAMKLEAAGAALALDARWPGVEKRLADGLHRLLANDPLRHGLSEKSAALCDGRGAERVAEAILAL